MCQNIHERAHNASPQNAVRTLRKLRTQIKPFVMRFFLQAIKNCFYIFHVVPGCDLIVFFYGRISFISYLSNYLHQEIVWCSFSGFWKHSTPGNCLKYKLRYVLLNNLADVKQSFFLFLFSLSSCDSTPVSSQIFSLLEYSHPPHIWCISTPPPHSVVHVWWPLPHPTLYKVSGTLPCSYKQTTATLCFFYYYYFKAIFLVSTKLDIQGLHPTTVIWFISCVRDIVSYNKSHIFVSTLPFFFLPRCPTASTFNQTDIQSCASQQQHDGQKRHTRDVWLKPSLTHLLRLSAFSTCN